MGYGTYRGTFLGAEGANIEVKSDTESIGGADLGEALDYQLTGDFGHLVELQRTLRSLEPGDAIEFDIEFERYGVCDVRPIELNPRHLLARIKRIEQHLGLEPESWEKL